MGTGVIMQKDDFVRQRSRAFWLYGTSLHPQPPRNEPYLFTWLHFQCLDEHTLFYAHLQNYKETTVWTCAFPLCMSLTLLMTVSIRNNIVASFCEECFVWRVFGFHLTAPHIGYSSSPPQWWMNRYSAGGPVKIRPEIRSGNNRSVTSISARVMKRW